MEIVIPKNTHQLKFEYILKKNKNVKYLDCEDCTELTSIPNVEGLEALWCYGCTSLTSISNIETLKLLNCCGCTNLKSIPNIQGLKDLSCCDCTSLTSIPGIKGLERLSFNHSTNIKIRNIKYLPNLIDVNSDFYNFKQINLFYHKLDTLKSNIHKQFAAKLIPGFTNDFFSIINSY